MLMPCEERVPPLFCLTVDADWVPGSHVGFARLLEFADRFNIQLTVFFTGRFALEYPDLVMESVRRGDAIGAHGWEHGLNQEENFYRSSFGDQEMWIAKTTEVLEKITGSAPVMFRAPFLAPSAVTIAVLERLGYAIDSSIPARRWDFGLGQVNSGRYFFSPLTPYHPSRDNIAVRGTSPIWEVPPSAFGVPLNMRALSVVGLAPLKWATHRLATRTSGLVFYAHPLEFGFAPSGAVPSLAHLGPEHGRSNLQRLEEFFVWVSTLGYAPATISALVPA